MLDEQMRAASMENSPPRVHSPVLERAVSPGARSDCSHCSSRGSDGEHDSMDRPRHQPPHSPVPSSPQHSPKPIHNGLTSPASPSTAESSIKTTTKSSGVELDLDRTNRHLLASQELARTIRHHQIPISPNSINTNNNNEKHHHHHPHHLASFVVEPPRTVTAPSFLIRDILGGNLKPKHDSLSSSDLNDAKCKADIEQRLCVDDAAAEEERRLASSRHSPSLLGKRHHDDDDDCDDDDEEEGMYILF